MYRQAEEMTIIEKDAKACGLSALVCHHGNRSKEQYKNDEHKDAERTPGRVELRNIIERLRTYIAQPE